VIYTTLMPTGESLANLSDLSNVTSLASDTASNAVGMASDVLIVLVLAAVLLLFSMRVGRGPFIASLLAFYAAYAVYFTFPYMAYLPTAPALTSVLSRGGLFIALTVIFYIILRRVVVSDFLYVGIFGQILLSILGTGFIIAMLYHVFDISSVYQFSPTIDLLFAAKEYFFFWFIAPAVGLFFIAR